MDLFKSPSSKKEESNDTKKCTKCLADIPKKAMKCSHCRSNQTQKLAGGCLIIVLIFIVIIVVALSSGENDSPTTSQEPQNDTLSIGEDGMLNNNEIKTDCSGATSLGTTKENYSALIEAITIDDRLGYSGMLGNGEAFLVNNCTKVKMIDTGLAVREVRILEGKYIGESGWTAFEFVIKNTAE